jgi:hypothetical protein
MAFGVGAGLAGAPERRSAYKEAPGREAMHAEDLYLSRGAAKECSHGWKAVVGIHTTDEPL